MSHVEADVDYWKMRYKTQWQKSLKREDLVKSLIEEVLSSNIVYCGLGAGSKIFISGNAASRGYRKGEADLKIVDLDIFVEVTGTDKEVMPSADLWLRPDKILAAQHHQEVWVVHILDRYGLLRTISLNSDFMAAYSRQELETISVTIGDAIETYVTIPAKSRFVNSFGLFLERLKERETEEIRKILGSLEHNIKETTTT